MKCLDHPDKDDECAQDQLQHRTLHQSDFIGAAGLDQSENTVYEADGTQNRQDIHGANGIGKDNGKDDHDSDQCDISAPVKGFLFFHKYKPFYILKFKPKDYSPQIEVGAFSTEVNVIAYHNSIFWTKRVNRLQIFVKYLSDTGSVQICRNEKRCSDVKQRFCMA